jgi:hypothetical protein
MGLAVCRHTVRVRWFRRVVGLDYKKKNMSTDSESIRVVGPDDAALFFFIFLSPGILDWQVNMIMLLSSVAFVPYEYPYKEQAAAMMPPYMYLYQ